jgi:hypothetical protein
MFWRHCFSWSSAFSAAAIDVEKMVMTSRGLYPSLWPFLQHIRHLKIRSIILQSQRILLKTMAVRRTGVLQVVGVQALPLHRV